MDLNEHGDDGADDSRAEKPRRNDSENVQQLTDHG